jgi:hypothetical protein
MDACARDRRAYDVMTMSAVVVVSPCSTSSTPPDRAHRCAPGTASRTTTSWYCCIGAGKWDGEIPGKRACPPGFYQAVITSVVPPAGSTMVWDGVSPTNGVEFTPSHE